MLCYMAEGFKLQVKLRSLISWSLNRELILNYLSGFSIIARVLKSGMRKQQSFREKCEYGTKSEWCPSVDGSEDGKVVMNQRMWVAYRKKGQGNSFSSRVSRKEHSLLMLWFCLGRSMLESFLQNCKILNSCYF